MKRMLLGGTAALMAAAAFAAPAQAQDDMSAPCGGKPLVECVRDLVVPTYHPPCNGDPVTECVRELANDVIDIVNRVGPIVGDACEIVFPDCVSVPLP